MHDDLRKCDQCWTR